MNVAAKAIFGHENFMTVANHSKIRYTGWLVTAERE